MSLVETVTIDGKTYNIAQASAIQQKELMTLIGGRIALNMASSGVDEINVSMLKGALMTSPSDTLDRIHNIVLYKCTLNNNLVDIKDFQGQMNAYFTLLAEAIKVNLKDFFTWLEDEAKSGGVAKE